MIKIVIAQMVSDDDLLPVSNKRTNSLTIHTAHRLSDSDEKISKTESLELAISEKLTWFAEPSPLACEQGFQHIDLAINM